MKNLNTDVAAHISLCEALDRVLTKGVVLHGDVLITVADVDLIYVGLRVLLASVETAQSAGIMVGRPNIANGKV